MSGEQRKSGKASASTEASAGGEEKHDKHTGDGNSTGATLQAPLVKSDASLRVSANAQVGNNDIEPLTRQFRPAKLTVTSKTKPTSPQPTYSNKESGASCPDSRRMTANHRPTLSSKTEIEDGSRVNNPVFHAPNCNNLAHTPGKRSRGSQEVNPEDGDDVSSQSPVSKRGPTTSSNVYLT